ncbi:MAG: hypothetical protein OEZ16_06495 [Chromatiales bacterium]|nr:hypothetical protein [Chromatiales bacterium]
MKRILGAAVISLGMMGAGNLQSADFNYSGNYGGSVAGGMMGAMWDFMEWFLGRRNRNWYNPNTYSGWDPYSFYGYRPAGNGRNPYRYQDYWSDPNNPWVDMQPLEGVWLAQSGEYWYVRGSRFVLVDTNGNRSGGEFRMEGDFIITRMPGGEAEFEYRQMDDVLIMRDLHGRLMILRRVEAGGWNW